MELSICIPTFNRADKIKKLLNFLSEELENIHFPKIQIEFILGDNSSNLFTQNVCFESRLYKNDLLTYIKNEKNLGLIGNVLNLANLAKGNYIWFMGDDDDYHENIITLVQEAVLEDNYSYIFLNHRAYFEGKRYITGFESAIDLNRNSIYKEGKVMAFDIWNSSCTSLMFISACIFKRIDLEQCLKTRKKKDIAYPLHMSFYCAAQGKTRIINQVCIDNIWGSVSWSKSSEDVFLNYVPRILYYLPSIGYSHFQSYKIISKYIWARKRSFTTYWLKKFFIHKKLIIN